ncbi:MAG TPA: glycosyltransferase family 4 protein [Bryobacteraceae bacterium]|nr:glycosyltransferase family 4 protein [Bryobacteraceae bacterium]
MRLAIANWSLRATGGAEKYIECVGNELARRGHQILYIHEIDQPSEIARIPFDPRVETLSMSSLGCDKSMQAARAWQADVVYVHGMLEPEREAMVQALAPSVFFAHNYYGTCITGGKTTSFPLARPCGRVFGPACLLRFYPLRCGGLNPQTAVREYRKQSARLRLLCQYDAVLTNSRHMAQEYRNHQIACRELPFFCPPGSGAARKENPSFPSDTVRLMFLGRMDRLKGGATFIESIPHLVEHLDGKVEVVFAGSGPERSLWTELSHQVARSNPRIAFRWHEWLSKEELKHVIAGVHAVVMPSIWPEPFGLAGLEAGRLGVPAVAFASGGITDWLRDGRNGFTAPADPPTSRGLAAAIARCFETPDIYARLCAGAREAAEEFSLERHVACLERLLEQVASPSGSPELKTESLSA